MTFREAFEIWIEQRLIAGSTKVRFIKPRTERDLRQYARAAGLFFDRLPLGEITDGHLNEYQRARAQCDKSCGDFKQAAGANLIRKEVQLVIRVLRAAGLWATERGENFEIVEPAYADVPRAMTPEQQMAWLGVAASRPGWRTVYWWSLVALATTAATNELRSIRLGDISLTTGTIEIRSENAKNKYRLRTIPLQSPEVLWALDGLMERARMKGAFAPFHFLFPFHVTGDQYDPARPMSVWGLRKLWDQVRDEADLRWVTPYDLRHTAITRMAEAGVPIQVIMAFAGHISRAMQQHYTTISMQAKRRWAAQAFLAQAPHQLEAPGSAERGRGRWVWESEGAVIRQ